MDEFPSPEDVDIARRKALQPAIDRWCASLATQLAEGKEGDELEFVKNEIIRTGVIEKIQSSGQWTVTTGSRSNGRGANYTWIKVTRRNKSTWQPCTE